MLSATTRKSLGRPLTALYSRMSQLHSGTRNISQGNANCKTALIPFSSRLTEGRALAQDVWTVFK
jgi:hypothetical protein